MSLLSQTATYALRAVLHIAAHGDEEPVTVDELSEALDLPRNYLSKTLHTLAGSGLLVSVRGRRGGFRLAEVPRRLTLYHVVRPFEDLPERRECLLGRTECRDDSPCPLHGRWKSLSEQVTSFFRETTLDEVLAGPVAPAGTAPPPE